MWITYSACGPFTKSKEQIEKFKETGFFLLYRSGIMTNSAS